MTSPLPMPDRAEVNREPDRAAINRENAQHSTGPRTAEGKERVRLNAVKHGLYAKTLIVPEADQAAFEEDGRILDARYRPATDQEREVVDLLHESRWRLSGAVATERNLQRLTEEQQLESIDNLFGLQDEESRRALALASGLQANAKLFDQLSRHQARLQHSIEQACRDLHYLISHRVEKAKLAKLAEQSQPAAHSTHPEMPQFTGSLAEFKRKQWIKQQEKRN